MMLAVLSGLLVVSLLTSSVQPYDAAAAVQEHVNELCSHWVAQGYPDIKVPVKGYCHVYLQCGSPNHLPQCPTGLFFSPDQKACVDSSLAHCPYDPCQGKEDGVMLDDRATCHGFYVCLEGVSHYRACYNGYRFSAPSGKCLRDASCHSGLTPAVSGCDDNQYLASREHPGVYFQRVPGGSYLKRPCPEGLVFDTKVCVCNFPESYYIEHEKKAKAARGSHPDKAQQSTY